jgi:hypothetical protein
MIRTLPATLGTMCLLAAVVPAAGAATAAPITDCTAHGHLTQTYSPSQLRTSLAQMPADVQEYTNCYDVIRSALLGGISGGHAPAVGSSSSSGGSFLPTPVIVVIVVLALGGATAGAVAIRRRGSSD